MINIFMVFPGPPRNILIISIVLFCFSFVAAKGGDKNLFPCPENLKANVDFWENIYSKYESKQGLIHHQDSLSITYEIIDISGMSPRRQKKILQKKRKSYSNGESIRLQKGMKNKYRAGLKRSGRYLERIRQIFKSFDLPERLIYLPHVESSFNYRAYSHKGAAGIWQFIRSTGRSYLRVDYLIDQRLDPVASSYAAAKLLKRNFETLQSWPLALTAYNHGLHGMTRAVKETGTRDIGRIVAEYKGRRFRFASRNFYAEFLAASKIAMNYRDYFGNVEMENPMEYREIKLKRKLYPQDIAKALGLSLDTFKTYNLSLRPALYNRRRKIPKDFTIKLPVDISMNVDSALAAIPEPVVSDKDEAPVYYKIRRGDNLLTIAKVFDVSLTELAETNGINRGTRIYAGQILLIPAVNYAEGKPRKRSPKPEPAPAKTVAMEKKESVTPKTPLPFEETEEQLVYSRYLDLKTLEESETSQENARTGKDTSHFFNENIYTLDVHMDSTGQSGTITVSLDETMSHYADWLLVPYRSILELNELSARRTRIKSGQKLKVRFVNRTVAEFKRIRLEYHMALEEDFYNAYSVTGTFNYRIKRGDNLWDLTAETGVPDWLMRKYNPKTDLSRLHAGQTITMPELKNNFSQE